ncbi:MAG: hypothetical protein AB1717_07290 [Pseudomonadota bacterium]
MRSITRRADDKDVISNKEMGSPVCIAVGLRSAGVATGEKAHHPPFKAQWFCFARFYVHTLHNLPLIRASNFLCLHKESHQRNAPHEAALRASRGLTCSNRAAPTRRPVATTLNAPSMAL